MSRFVIFVTYSVNILIDNIFLHWGKQFKKSSTGSLPGLVMSGSTETLFSLPPAPSGRSLCQNPRSLPQNKNPTSGKGETIVDNIQMWLDAAFHRKERETKLPWLISTSWELIISLVKMKANQSIAFITEHRTNFDECWSMFFIEQLNGYFIQSRIYRMHFLKSGVVVGESWWPEC